MTSVRDVDGLKRRCFSVLHLLCSDSQLTSFKLCTFEIEQVLGIMLDLTNPGEVSV